KDALKAFAMQLPHRLVAFATNRDSGGRSSDATLCAVTSSPTVRRRRIARELRQQRERKGLTLDQAARQLDMSKSNLSRIENAQIGIKPRDVRAALALYGVTGADAEALVEIARGAQQRGWWQNYSGVLPEWFEFYVGL